MANDHVKMFAEEYGPIAVQVSKQTGIAPSVLLAQWGMESDYGRKPVGHFNFGNIKDMSGTGTQATDNKTKSKDKYLNFESPEAFGDYYAHMMRRLYPNALNSGADISKYAEGLRTGVKGSYAEDENYENAIRGAHNVTSSVYTDPEKIDTVRPPTQAEQIQQERADRGDTGETTTTTNEPNEVVSPAVAAGVGALTSGAGQIGFRPEYPGPAPEVNAIRESHRNTVADLESSANKTLESLNEAANKAQLRHQIAADRLQKRMDNPNPLGGGPSLAELENEFKISQTALQSADRELQARITAQKAKVPSTPAPAAPNAPAAGSMASATPSGPAIITDPNAPLSRTATEQILQGTIDPETGTTGRQRQGYNEVTSYQALLREEQQKALAELQKKGLVPDTGQSVRVAFGAPSSTPSGLLVTPDVAAPINQQAELQQRMENDKLAQEKLAQQQEMDRLKNERALAAQRHAEAKRRFDEAQKAKTSGVNRAQTAAETAEDRALAAQEDLARGQTTQQQKFDEGQRLAKEKLAADLKAARAAPGPVGRVLENTGVAVGKTAPWNPVGRTAMGALGGFQAASGANTLANIPVAELIKRFNAGDRSPEVMQALAQAGVATAQTGLGLGAMLPAAGPKVNRIKGAGTIGTLGMGLYQGYKALQDEAAKEGAQ
jgi:hypothetical protein